MNSSVVTADPKDSRVTYEDLRDELTNLCEVLSVNDEFPAEFRQIRLVLSLYLEGFLKNSERPLCPVCESDLVLFSEAPMIQSRGNAISELVSRSYVCPSCGATRHEIENIMKTWEREGKDNV